MEKMVNVYFSGKRYSVPADLTIMTAMEYAGYTWKRGCGCRHGFCGACATIYRIKGDNELKTCLACQTQVQEGMYVASIPSVSYTHLDAGYEVDIVEKTPSIGGRMSQLDKTFPTLDCSACILTPKMVEAAAHDKINIYTYSEVEKVSGFVGDFTVEIRKKMCIRDSP